MESDPARALVSETETEGGREGGMERERGGGGVAVREGEEGGFVKNAESGMTCAKGVWSQCTAKHMSTQHGLVFVDFHSMVHEHGW